MTKSEFPNITNYLSSKQVKQIDPEPQEGNIEYKWKLVAKSADRLEKLCSQMQWRLNEAAFDDLSFAIYFIGVLDDGTCKGIDLDDLQASIETLYTLATRLSCLASIISID